MPPKHRDQNILDDNPTIPDQQNNNAPNPPSTNDYHSKNKDHNPGKSSLWNRIQTSATTLVQDAVTRPSGTALGADLAQTLNNSTHGKVSSLSPASASSYSSSLLGPSSSSSSISIDNDQVGHKSFFRSPGDSAQGAGFELDHFDQDTFQNTYHIYGHDDDVGETDVNRPPQKGKGKYDPTLPVYQQQRIESDAIMDSILHDLSEYEIAWINAINTTTRIDTDTDVVAASEPTGEACSLQQHEQSLYGEEKDEDGAAVVRLLSDPSFQPGLDFDSNLYSDELGDDGRDMTDGDGYPLLTAAIPLTTEETKIIDSFRRQSELEQQQQGYLRTGARITDKSLIPDIGMFLTRDEVASADNATLRNAVLSHLPGAEDWMGVDERYHDEVWGYLRPALEAASTELEKEGDGNGDGPAVKRLKMILRHMREG